jgi:cytochrome oxidase assembly protein ShyY1
VTGLFAAVRTRVRVVRVPHYAARAPLRLGLVQTRSRPSDWFAAARRPRMVSLLLVLLVAALACVRLGAWQLDRAAERSEQAAARAVQAEDAAPPVPLDEVVGPQAGFTAAMVGRRVSVAGEYLDADQYLVPEEGPEGEPGAVVLAGLRVTRGAGAGAILPVVRGWVAGGAADWAAELGPDGDLAAPRGRVAVVGTLAGSEAATASSGADGTLGSISAGQLANLWGAPIYSGHLRLVSAQPPEPPELRPAPGPGPSSGGGLALQNLAYAAQWWIFGGFALAVWLRLVRDEAARLRE